ncbi:hypothetical protein G7K_1995-t1 [Saitoella complicata NRRL Y-17804]|uniref:Uncharacterized protein n=1 Tax=Saitoella complicata (strain BCRC 22490 / CBS 7301 / JCM 7358 / NBRC 10748 / NRRL Y-17804) TaxID=698492 RepID=A0A0E9ND66_SAICN|nr:hypothetical protein G7K_1995-t1 [Saitoella complicata NRRL Y-17804]
MYACRQTVHVKVRECYLIKRLQGLSSDDEEKPTNFITTGFATWTARSPSQGAVECRPITDLWIGPCAIQTCLRFAKGREVNIRLPCQHFRSTAEIFHGTDCLIGTKESICGRVQIQYLTRVAAKEIYSLHFCLARARHVFEDVGELSRQKPEASRPFCSSSLRRAYLLSSHHLCPRRVIKRKSRTVGVDLRTAEKNLSPTV